jgi:hypothetical protein
VRKTPALLLFATLFLLALAGPLSATATFAPGDRVPIADLIKNMRKYDGKVVTIRGQAVGDGLMRGDFGWVTIDDDPFSNKSAEEGGALVGMSNISMSVWAPKPDVEQVRFYGGYKNQGDAVRVTGVFHRACPEHGGDTDIHASGFEVIRLGHGIRHSIQYPKLIAVILLSAIIVLLWYALKGRPKRRHG